MFALRSTVARRAALVRARVLHKPYAALFSTCGSRLQHTPAELNFPEEKGLAPLMSAESLSTHYNSHYLGFVAKYNAYVRGTPWEYKTVVDAIHETHKETMFAHVQQSAGQIWSHEFFFNCLRPGGSEIPEPLEIALTKSFGSVDEFKELFTANALSIFGSGWVWLVEDAEKQLKVVTTASGEVPFTKGQHPILALDMWEHAYYKDFGPNRKDYVDKFWSVINWDFVTLRWQLE